MRAALEQICLREPVCKCSSVSRAEEMLIFLAIGLRHNFSWEAIVDVLEGFNVILSHEAIPSIIYKVQKYFPVEIEEITYHHYCSNCRRYLGTNNDDDPIVEYFYGADSSDPKTFFCLRISLFS